MDGAKTTAKGYKKHWNFGIWCDLYKRFYGICNTRSTLICNDCDRECYFRMMTSSNGTIFRVTCHLCGNSPVPGEVPAQRPVTRSFDVFFDLLLNKRLSKHAWGWWFDTLSCPLWRHSNVITSRDVSERHARHLYVTPFMMYWVYLIHRPLGNLNEILGK